MFPIFEEGAEAMLTPFSETSSFQYLTTQSHNLHVLGQPGFEALCRLARIPAAELRFGTLSGGLAGVAEMMASTL
ncbi:MAG: hypothetical protein V4503_01850 [Gemmatimonadota bacterium]